MSGNAIKRKCRAVRTTLEARGLGKSVAYYACRVLSKLSMHIVGRIAAHGRIHENRLVFKNREFLDFTDNPRALFEYLTENGYQEKYEIIYLVSDKKNFHDIRIKNVKFATAESRNGFSSPVAFYYGATAKYFFFTHNSADLNRFHCKGQVTVNLWHGCGYKGGGLDNKDIPRSETMAAFDYALVPGQLFAKSKSENWGWDREKILCMGYPRYDWMLSAAHHAELESKGAGQPGLAEGQPGSNFQAERRPGNVLRKEMLLRLGVSEEKQQSIDRLVIWMPTFRKSALTGQGESKIDLPYALPGLQNEAEMQELDEHCRANRILLFIRKHPLQTNWEKPEKPYTNILDITGDYLEKRQVQLYRLLGICDGLISDYSSAAVDFMLLGRPMAFVLTDYEAYRQARGFVFENPLEYMPGEKVYDLNGIQDFLIHVAQGSDLYREEREKLLPVMHNPTENYCRRLLDFLGIVKQKRENL